MRIAIVAPSGVPFQVGGAEKLWWGLVDAINQATPHHADLIKLPAPEQDLWALMESYRAFARLDLAHFDLVISTKYPAWMASHPNHLVYLQHKLRGLYDTYHLTGLPDAVVDAPAPVRALLEAMDRRRFSRASLEGFFDALFALREDPRLPPELFAFPGPLARVIVHFLDRLALAPGQICRYAAISDNVRRRRDYFPDGVAVGVVHHPSDLRGFACGTQRHLFTASRLDGAKRLDLLIRAYREVPGETELLIAGTGPAAQELEALARPDPRVRLLGHISDAEMIRHYRDAAFVPFIPYDEDYGLITIEAMQSGKPVLTTTDAGGVNEFVAERVTGRSVSPTADALAAAMTEMLADPQGLARMGRAAQDRVRAIDWPRTVAALLQPFEAGGRGRAARRRILVAVDFPVHPPQSGGPSRIAHLYRELAANAEITLLTLCDDPRRGGEQRPAAGLRELCIAKSPAHLEVAAALDAELGASVGDLATLLHHHRTPAYGEALARAAERADLVIASHPYLYPAIAAVYDGPLWYEAHNVEYDMKRAVIGTGAAAAPYLARVRAAEAAACTRAQRVLVCSAEDAQRFETLYGGVAGKALLAANGVDTRAIAYTGPAERARRKARLGLDGRLIALFIGSWHQPNIEAAAALKRIAADCAGVDFLVAGSVCDHAELRSPPSNLHPLGVLSDAELRVVTAAADVALNLARSGSGTNLKMLHYAAAGLPILSTGFGLRGLALRPREHLWQAEAHGFPAALRALRETDAAAVGAMTERARLLIEQRYDWRVIAAGVCAVLKQDAG